MGELSGKEEKIKEEDKTGSELNPQVQGMVKGRVRKKDPILSHQ